MQAGKPTPGRGPAEQIETLKVSIAFFSGKIKTGVAPGTTPRRQPAHTGKPTDRRLGFSPSAGSGPSTRRPLAWSTQPFGRSPLKIGGDETKLLPRRLGSHRAARRPAGQGGNTLGSLASKAAVLPESASLIIPSGSPSAGVFITSHDAAPEPRGLLRCPQKTSEPKENGTP